MKTVTLEDVEKKFSKLGEMIAQLKAAAKTAIFLPETNIELAHDEHYAGVVLGKDGAASYHLILLCGEKKDINWQDATDWAKKQGGELPTRREQALLYANLKEQFTDNYYWSGETHASDSGCAWCQGFDYGGQDGWDKDLSLRARAVRRVAIE